MKVVDVSVSQIFSGTDRTYSRLWLFFGHALNGPYRIPVSNVILKTNKTLKCAHMHILHPTEKTELSTQENVTGNRQQTDKRWNSK